MYYSALSLQGNILNSDTDLTFYRRHTNNTSILHYTNFSDYKDNRIRLLNEYENNYNLCKGIFDNPEIMRKIKCDITDLHMELYLLSGIQKQMDMFHYIFVRKNFTSRHKIKTIGAYYLFRLNIFQKIIIHSIMIKNTNN
jgi:hypothetical protein